MLWRAKFLLDSILDFISFSIPIWRMTSCRGSLFVLRNLANVVSKKDKNLYSCPEGLIKTHWSNWEHETGWLK
jgi:hypothetical protein